jgi:FlaG/FlaF family flagellin (archaellin)
MNMLKESKEYAVSPVVGVMLMLVVTILIAAVVSAFSGGLSSSQSKTPQALVSGEFSQSRGMVINHDGGDVLSATDLRVLISPTNVWGTGSEGSTWEINKSVMVTNGTLWATGQYQSVKKFGPGDRILIDQTNLATFQQYMGGGDIFKTSDSNWLGNPSKLGYTFQIKFFDTKTQKVFATSSPITIMI